MATDPALERVPGGWLAPGFSVETLGWRVLMSAPVAIGAALADGRFLFANDALFDLIGFPPEVVFGHGWLRVLFPEPGEAEATQRLIETMSLEEGAARRHQRQITRGDGTRRLLDLSSTGFQLPDGRRGSMSTVLDVTAQWMPIGASARGFKELVDDAPDVLSRVDVRSGRFLFVSRAIEKMTGYSPEEIYNNADLLMNGVQPEFRARFLATLAEVARGTAQSMVVGVSRRDGGSILVQQTFYPVADATGKVVVIEGLARDITQVRALERELEKTIEELRKRNEELASLDQMKSQLLANVSHELRTPLVSIKGYNELILRGSLGPLTPKQRRGLEIAGANTERLVELIETLLDFARREEGRLTLHRARFDLRVAVREAIGQLAQRIAAGGIDLTVDLTPDPLEVEGDHARLTQVFRALLSNAEKFCEEPGASVQVRARREGDQVEISVTDSGIGIPEAALGKVFERFYQVDASSTRRHGGAGLGLAMAKEIVTLHGGQIAVASAPGKGSAFTVTLPLVSRPADVKRPSEQRVLLLGALGPRFAELKGALEAGGYAILGADGPGDVVRRARRHRPDAVVLGFSAREIAEALDELRRDGDTGGVPVVAVVDEGERAALMARADHVIEPHQIAQLAPAIGRLLAEEGAIGARAGGRAPWVVIVDDEPENLDFTRFVLEREGFEVVCVGSGEAALSRIDERCDLVILDIAMEGLDGIEVCRRMKEREDTRGVPVLVVTAMTGDEIRRASFAAGADGFLIKPFGVGEFLRQVRLHLRVVEEGLPRAEKAENA